MSRPVSKGRKIVGIVLLCICAALVLYFAAVMIYRLSTLSAAKRLSAVTRFLAEFFFTSLLSVPAFDLCFGIFSWGARRAAKVAGGVLRVVFCLYCALYLALIGVIVGIGATGDDAPSSQVCVLGLAIDGDELPADLVYRLDTALAYNADHPDAVFVATGGNSEDPARSEAAHMVRYLEAHGFDTSSTLIAETQAQTTVGNFVESAAYLDKEAPVVVITNGYHMFRASKIAKKQGYTAIVRCPAPSEPLLYAENVMWEGICSIFETLRGNMAF